VATLTSSFAISYINRAAGKVITTTTAATGYPASNLNTSKLSSSYRTTAGSLTTQNIDVDLSSAQDIDVIGLIGTNLTDAATRTPKTAENSAFTSPEYNPGSANVFDLTYPDLIADTRRYGRNLIILPGQTYNSRYIRTTLNNTGNPSNYLSARVYWIGPIWQPGISFGVKEGTFKKKKEYVGEPGVERSLTVLEVSFDVLTEAEGNVLESLCAARLRSGRLLVIPRPTQPATWQSEALYCTLQGLPTLTAWPQGGGEIKWKVQLTFRECED
jgi:hypothetical protein